MSLTGVVKGGLPRVYTYTLPEAVIRRYDDGVSTCGDPSCGQNVFQTTIREALATSPFATSDPHVARFFYVPLSFHWGGRGRRAVSAVLSYLRAEYPFFNRSLDQQPAAVGTEVTINPSATAAAQQPPSEDIITRPSASTPTPEITHLLTFTGDLAMDAPPAAHWPEPLLPEV